MAFESVKSRIAAYKAEAEQWQIDHDQAMECLDLEVKLQLGLSIYEVINFIDEHVRSAWRSGKREFDQELETTITQLYKEWLSVSEEIESELSGVEKNFEVEYSRPFQKAVAEVRGILQDDSNFFCDQKLLDLRDEAIDEYLKGSCESL